MGCAYLLEIAYAIMFAYPARLLAEYLKEKENIDVFDVGINFTPFKF